MRYNAPVKTTGKSSQAALATALTLGTITAAIFTSAAIADGPGPTSADDGPSRRHVQTIIQTRDMDSLEATSRSNIGVVAQTGTDNRARISQSRHRAAVASGNYASITQRGTNNEANIIQSGGNNIGVIGQLGRDHEATIEQTGIGFEARIDQRGMRSSIDISQSGSGLRSISVQQDSVSGMTAPVIIRTN